MVKFPVLLFLELNSFFFGLKAFWKLGPVKFRALGVLSSVLLFGEAILAGDVQIDYFFKPIILL